MKNSLALTLIFICLGASAPLAASPGEVCPDVTTAQWAASTCSSIANCQSVRPSNVATLTGYMHESSDPEQNSEGYYSTTCVSCGTTDTGDVWAVRWIVYHDPGDPEYPTASQCYSTVPTIDGSNGAGGSPPQDGGDPSNGGAGNPPSPIFISRVYQAFLSNFTGAVQFDIDADGQVEIVSWNAAGNHGGWLVMDRNGNGVIDDGGEMFGDSTPGAGDYLPNGFNALAVLDDNRDGLVDAKDRAFSGLRIWVDANANGFSEVSELLLLPEFGIEALSTSYTFKRHVDPYGNVGRQWGYVWWSDGTKGEHAVDWWLKVYGADK